MGVRAGAAGWGRPFRFGLSRSCGRTFIDTISPAEIEDVLAAIRSISETAAVLGESEIGLAEIVLYIVPAPGADGSAAVAAARERLSRALPPYKRPRRFEIAHDLPRTATGKVQRNKLREQLQRDPH